MFDTEAHSLDRHFGYQETEGPVTLVTRAMLAANRHGQLASTDITHFLVAIKAIREHTKGTPLNEDVQPSRPWFTLVWTSLKPQPSRPLNWITDEVRIFALKRLKQDQKYQLLFHGRDTLLRRVFAYHADSIDALALQCAVRLHEDLLIRIAFSDQRIRREVASIVRIDQDDFRERMLAITARAEAHKAYLNWEPLRRLMSEDRQPSAMATL